MTAKDEKKRVYLLDEIRGLCILLMVAYHATFDFVYFFNIDIPIFHARFFDFAQPFVAGIFIFISGIACRFSKNNLKRGALVLGLAAVVSLVTWIMYRDQFIIFGILHLLGLCMIVFALARPLLDKLHPVGAAVVFALLFAFTLGVKNGHIGFPPLSLEMPRELYRSGIMTALGFSAPSFASFDYFPVLPWMPLFLCGSCVGVYFAGGHLPAFFYQKHAGWLCAVGKRTLIIYMLHQPVVYGVMWLLFKVVS